MFIFKNGWLGLEKKYLETNKRIGCSKMFRCKARKNRIVRRIKIYVERRGLQRNPDFIGTGERFVKPSALSGKEGVQLKLHLPTGMRFRSTVPQVLL